MRLWVIDGGKALRKAIVETFGALALIQRCQEHKRRNVIEHLPEEMHASVGRALRDAWSSHDDKLARKQLMRLAASLQARHPGAAASLREGLEETLTLQGLEITGALYRHAANDQPDREPQRVGGALLAQRAPMEGRLDDPALGSQFAERCQRTIPQAARIRRDEDVAEGS